MLPTSQEVLIDPRIATAGEGAFLAEAFSNFITASSRLEISYRDLQAEVAELSQALSERNRALSESLSENEALSLRLQRIMETIPCGVLVVDGEGVIQLANPEAARLLSLSRDEAPLDQAADLLAPALRLELHPLLTTVEDDERELCFRGSEGGIWVAVRQMHLPEVSSAQEKKQVVFTLRDISARKRMEAEREEARDSVALAQVSALLAHEIRNPLASLELFASLVEDDPERREEWLSHLRAGIRSLSCTVNNVLTLHGSTPLSLESVDVLREGALAIDFLKPLARQAEVHLHFRSEPMPHAIHVRGNRSAIHQILLNLCTNALRHTPAGGHVEVRCEAQDGLYGPVRIAVSDSGCGIPEGDLPHLFETGFSGSGTTSGLGLAVCQRLVARMCGVLYVSSRVGQGSTFTLEFPQ